MPNENIDSTPSNLGFAEGSWINEETLGKPRILDGRLVWDPPPHLDPAVVDVVKQSLEALNLSIEKGENTLTPKGEVE